MSSAAATQKTATSPAIYRDMANAIRALSMDAVERAASGHPGMPMGMADVATVLFSEHLSFDPRHPLWPGRDRFVLSAGHGSMLQYALLYLTGYEDMTLDEIRNFRKLGAKTAGHPEFGHATGIETTTGPLGQGLANAVGMALAQKLAEARMGAELCSHYTYAIAGDGCLMEGISQEAISIAGHLKLSRLIVLFDDNKISIDGPTSLTVSEDTLKRFEACNWAVDAIDGHDYDAISAAISKAKKNDRPTLIACRTTIAYGAPTKAGTSASHGSPLGKNEIEGTRKALAWAHGEFEVPAPVLDAWRKAGAKGPAAYKEWDAKLAKADKTKVAEYERMLSGELPEGFNAAITALKQKLSEMKPSEATRKSSENVLEALVPVMPELIGG
ncbi:MAG: transketolase, partial [Rickettsiales bacterium]|nr:transketolase [Rickettsiales bacterium]